MCAVGLVITLTMSLPLKLYPAFNVLEQALPYHRCGAKKKWLLVLLERALVLCFMAVVAILVPSFGLFASLIGAIFGTTMIYVLPALYHFVLFKRERRLSFWTGVADVLVMLAGVVGGVTITIGSIIKIAKN